MTFLNGAMAAAFPSDVPPPPTPLTFSAFLCFSNVSVYVETEKAISLFLRGPNGTIWSFHNLTSSKLGVSSQVISTLYSG